MSQDINILGTSIEEDIRKKNLVKLLDQQEKNIATITDNIPGLSIFNQIKKMFTGVQDSFLIQKVYKFLFELSSMSTESRVSLIDKINDDPVYGQKFGTFLIAALDRHDFVPKSIMLARVCKYYEAEEINRSTFVRFKGIIQQMDIEDLVKLKYSYHQIFGYPDKRDDISLYQFQTMGLIQIRSGSELIVSGRIELNRVDYNQIQVNLTKFGIVFIKVINDYQLVDSEQEI
jgi:hypothetical protein